MSLYQISDPNKPNHESAISDRDIDGAVVQTVDGIQYYDYDVLSKPGISGSNILVPPQNYGTGVNPGIDESGKVEMEFSDFNVGSMDSALEEINNGRVGNINIVGTRLPKEAEIVINKDNQATSIKGIIEETSLSNIFFSDMNMDAIQQSIRYGVNKSTGKNISRQSDTTIYIIMRSIMLQYANFRISTTNLAEEIRSLNRKVIDYSVENISSNARQYIGYLQDLEKLPTPMDLPAYHNKNNFTYDISNLL